jgi:hypothetical protein
MCLPIFIVFSVMIYFQIKNCNVQIKLVMVHNHKNFHASIIFVILCLVFYCCTQNC